MRNDACVLLIIITYITISGLIISANSFDIFETIFGPKLQEKMFGTTTTTATSNNNKIISKRILNISTQHQQEQDATAGYYAKSFGYPFEVHKVITKDGYILNLHRIPYNNKKNNNGKKFRQPVLLHHGLFGSSDTFMLRGPKKDLCYVLSDAGYDVWLSNSRGNRYSRQHVELNPDTDAQYWNFSYHEMGYYDLPASIDYILNETHQPNLYYIGYSMGGTIGYILFSERPEYNTKVKLMINFAGVGIVTHRLVPHLKLVFSAIPSVIETLKERNINELFPQRELVGMFLKTLCQNGSPLQTFCVRLIYLIAGIGLQQFNTENIPKIFETYPCGSSIYTAMHYYQTFTSGRFAPLDFRILDPNATHIPPPSDYNLTKISVPISLHYAESDILVTKQDNLAMAKRLKNVVGVFKVPFSDFNHIDFVWGKDSKKLLYDQVLLIMDKFKLM